jgi:hypothetical protein
MSAAFLASLRRCRRPIVTIAVGLVLLQTLLAGLVTAQAAAANPFSTVICHDAAGAGSDDGTAPDTGKARPVCCTLCMAAAPALPPDHLPAVVRLKLGHAAGLSSPPCIVITLDPRAVRAGRSQAPPHSST